MYIIMKRGKSELTDILRKKTESELIKSELRTSISCHPNICLNHVIVLGCSYHHVQIYVRLVRRSDIYRSCYVFQSIRSSEFSETERSTSDQLVTDKVYSSLRGH